MAFDSRRSAARLLVTALFLLIAAMVRPVAAQTPQHPPAHPATAPPLTPAEAQQVLDVLNDPAKRAQFTATLDHIARALPETPAPAGAPARASQTAPSSAPGSAPAPAAAKPTATPSLLPQGLGAELLTTTTQGLETFSRQVSTSIRSLTGFPQLWRWLHRDLDDPESRMQLVETLLKLVIVLGVGVGVERLLHRGLRRLRALLARAQEEPPPPPPVSEGSEADSEPFHEKALRHRRLRTAWSTLRRLPFAIGGLLLDLLPVACFLVLGNLLLDTSLGEPVATRAAILAIVQAYAVTRAIMCVVRMMVLPPDPRARLFEISEANGYFLAIWIRRIVVVAVFGSALADVAELLGLSLAAHDALLKLVALIAHLLLVVLVLRSRAEIARRLRAPKHAHGAWARFRNGFAGVWHWIAIFYIVALWLVYAFEIPNGFTKLVHFFLLTVAVLAGAKLLSLVLFGTLDRALHVSPDVASRYPGLEARANRYYPILRATLSCVVAVITLVVLLEVWGLDAITWFGRGQLGSRIASAVVTIGVTAAVALAVWEGSNAGIDRHLARLTSGQPERAVRLRTLLPMLRTALLTLIVVMVGLTALSEIGVNIAPLLAGAGVVGVAIGFGSQKLVQDLITGLFLLLENAIQVGDVVSVSSLSGTVEHLSIRTIKLRALDGSMHIIPFSSVTTLTNQTRDYGFAVLDVTLSVNEEPDHIADVLREIGAAMRQEERWGAAIVADLDVLGVHQLLDDHFVLRARIKTVSSQRWAVMREFNRRVKYRFDELAIESPFTSHRILSAVPGPAPPEAA